MVMDPPIAELFGQGRPVRSVEFFPPKDDAGVEQLLRTAEAIRQMRPDFVSVTYGAGGSTRERTAQVCRLLKQKLGLLVMPHLTCVGSSRTEIEQIADRLKEEGFSNIMALRGDPPKGQAQFEVCRDGLRYASDLVRLLKTRHPEFCLGVAGYPETHLEATGPEEDLRNLKHKVDQGASFITTQLFFNNELFFRWRDRCTDAGIDVPIVPGIMPVLSLKQIRRFTQLCGATLPDELTRRLEAAGEDAAAVEGVGVAWALEQIQGLLKAGVAGYHLYILNRAAPALALASQLENRG